MLTLSTMALFLLAALGLLLIPGPSVLYIITRSVAQGKRAGLASVLGVELAGLTHAAAAALGRSALLFVLLASCTDCLYALLGSTAGRWLSRSARLRPIGRFVTGSVYIVLGVTAAFAGSDKK